MSKEFTLRFLLTGEITDALTKAFGTGNKLMQEYAKPIEMTDKQFAKPDGLMRLIHLSKSRDANLLE